MGDRDRDDWIETRGADDTLEPIPLIVVPHRESRLGQRLWPAIALLTVALLGIVYRASIADWQGWSSRPAPAIARLEPKPGPPEAAKPNGPAEPSPTPKIATAEPPKPAAPEAPKVVEPEAPKPKVDPWKEIEQAAEAKKAELAELDKIKEDEAEKSKTQPLRVIPPPNRAPFGAPMDAQQRAMLERFDRIRREQLAAHQRFMEQFQRGQGLAGQQMMAEMMRRQQDMMNQMRQMAGAPGLPPLPPPPLPEEGGFPAFGRNRPGMRSETKTIRTPNGVFVIRREWSVDGDQPGRQPEPGENDGQ